MAPFIATAKAQTVTSCNQLWLYNCLNQEALAIAFTPDYAPHMHLIFLLKCISQPVNVL
jgi:hypothetical protein